MKRIKMLIYQSIRGLSVAVSRFPFTVISLVAAAALVCYLIAKDVSPPLIVEKGIFTLGVGAFIGMVAQFFIERKGRQPIFGLAVYGIALVLTAGYFATIWPSPDITAEIFVRSFVAVFAMTCAVLWIPATDRKIDFNVVALVHFKSFFVSALYSGVLSAGIAAILFAVDTLLFNVNNDSYAYMMTIVWIVFAPVYYLSLLPRFGESGKWGSARPREVDYPRFLEILISYIAIPLFTIYTLVLLIYFAKILITTQWPVGQIGPMVLVYSAVGVVLYVLSSLPENSFAGLFNLVFPKIWIPIVLMQMVSVWIRIDAYGVTTSRYYVALFAIFSLVTALFLSVRPGPKNRYIALLAAAFAIVSIIPPVDAFSVSRNSQINRIESILIAEGMFEGGVIKPDANASNETKREVTSILSYLDRSSSFEYIPWLPKDFVMYKDMKGSFGFEPFYGRYPDNDYKYFYGSLDTDVPLNISGYDVSIVVSSYMNENEQKEFTFEAGGKGYKLISKRISKNDLEVTIYDADGVRVIGTRLLHYAEPMKEFALSGKDLYAPDEMTHIVFENEAEIKIIFQHISLEDIDKDFYADYTAYVLFKAPR